MPHALLIQLSQADVSRRLDQAIVVLVVLAILVAWLAEPAQPLGMLAVAGLLGLSWWVPRLLNGRRTRSACSPSSLCAQARVSYRQPVALSFSPQGALHVQWQADEPLVPAQELRILQLGSLLQLAFSTPEPPPSPLENVHFAPITPGNDGASSTRGAAGTLSSTSAPTSRANPPPSRHGSCLLWLGRLPPGQSAALRQWLLWRRRGEPGS